MNKKFIKGLSLLSITLAASASLTACKSKKDIKTTANNENETAMKFYLNAVSSGFVGSFEEWLGAIETTTIELQEKDGYICWKYSTDTEWKSIYNTASLTGDSGESAYQIYKKYHEDYTSSEDDWYQDLVSGKLEVTNSQTSTDTVKSLSYKLSSDGKHYIVTGIGQDIINTQIEIPSTYLGLPVTEIADYAFYYRSDISSIILPSSITTIGKSAFAGCTSLQTISLSASTYGADAFLNCSKLSKINYNGMITDWINNDFANEEANPMAHADNIYMIDTYGKQFNYNSNIVLDLPSTVKEIKQYALLNFDELLNIVIPSSVEKIGESSLKGCSGLYAITIPYVGNGTVQTEEGLFGYLFGDQKYLNSYAVNATYNSELDAKTYYVPTKLESVTLTGDSVIGYGAFQGVTSVKKFNIDASEIQEKAFDGCLGIDSIILSDKVSSIGDYVFKGMTNIERLDISNVTYIGKGAFENCTNLNEIVFSNKLTYIGDDAFSNCKGLKSLTIPEGVKYIGSNAFKNIDSLKTVVLPNSLEAIGLGAFSGCKNIEEITLTTLGSAKTKELYEEYNDDTYSASTRVLGYIFGTTSYEKSTATNQYYSSSNYKTYYIPDSLKKVNIAIETGDTELPYGFFNNCTNLKEINVLDTSCITTSLNDAFNGLINLKVLNVGNITTNLANDIKTLYFVEELYLNNSSTTIDSTTFENQTRLKKLVANAITEVGASSFIMCTNLEYVELNNCTTLNSNAFDGLANLNTVIIPNVTTINPFAFRGTTKLEKVENTKATTVLEYAFYNSGITTLDFKATTIDDYAFANSKIATIDINSCETFGDYAFNNSRLLCNATLEKAKSLGTSVFSGCTGLSGEINLSNLNQTTITPNCFSNTSISKVTLPSNVYVIDISAFENCTKLTDINLRKITTYYSNAFKNTSIKTVELNDSITDSSLNSKHVFDGITTIEKVYTGSIVNVKIGGDYSDFGTCENLITLTVSNKCQSLQIDSSCENIEYNYDGDLKFVGTKDNNYYALCGTKNASITTATADSSVIVAVNAFKNVTSLKSISIKKATCINEHAFDGATSLETVTLASAVERVKTYAFYNCSSLKNINIYSIITFYAYAFMNCTSLESISTAQTSTASFCFKGCTNLTTVTTPKSYKVSQSEFEGCTKLTSFDFTTVASIDTDGFKGCTSITEVTLTEYHTKAMLGAAAFMNCTGLKKFTTKHSESGKYTSITSIGIRAFKGCTNLTSIDLDSATTIYDYAFQDCTSLESWPMSKVTTIGDYAFSNCSSIQNGLFASLTSIDNYAFENCTKLQYIWSLSTFDRIGIGAFKKCTSFTSTMGSTYIDISAKIIDAEAFYGCTSLTTITLKNTTSIGNNAFANCTAVTEIVLPKTLDCVINESFNAFKGITKVTYLDIGGISFITSTSSLKDSFNNTISADTLKLLGVASISQLKNLIVNTYATKILGNIGDYVSTTTYDNVGYIKAHDIKNNTDIRYYAAVTCTLNNSTVSTETLISLSSDCQVIAEGCFYGIKFTAENSGIIITCNVKYVNSYAFISCKFTKMRIRFQSGSTMIFDYNAFKNVTGLTSSTVVLGYDTSSTTSTSGSIRYKNENEVYCTYSSKTNTYFPISSGGQYFYQYCISSNYYAEFY